MGKLTRGEKAPDFDFEDPSGAIKKLSDFKGKKVILYFYPKDNTPGCTAEACNLRDHHNELQQLGFEVIGVSTDSLKSHAKFRGKYELPFHLVSDTDKRVVEAYGVWGEKSMMGRKYMGIFRHTFVIDEKGVILAVIEKVDTKSHTKQIREELGI